jgi:hypothetical protein
MGAAHVEQASSHMNESRGNRRILHKTTARSTKCGSQNKLPLRNRRTPRQRSICLVCATAQSLLKSHDGGATDG